MQFPAVFVGGPPHSGKSVFVYSLKEAIAQLRPLPAYFLLRAAPDGEGDWSNEAEPKLVEELRAKHSFTPAFARRIAADIAGRHLPFLVDAGGLITPEQRRIAEACSHAILLSRDTEQLNEWRSFAESCGLVVIAELHSVLDGEDQIREDSTILRATIAGLERGTTKAGAVMDALVARLRRIFRLTHADAFAHYHASAPTDTVLDVRTMPPANGVSWTPAMLPAVLAELRSGVQVAVYGRGPMWLYAAIAAGVVPGRCYPFDARYGWVTPPTLQADGRATEAFSTTAVDRGDAVVLKIQLHSPHVRLEALEGAGVPAVPIDKGVILDGKLPAWLYVSLARVYSSAPWLGVYHPAFGGAAVVKSDDAVHPVGTIVEIDYSRR